MPTRYFGVIGNRDHIKIKGERKPFWDFLDRQPDGWLSSLAYLPLKDFSLPQGQKIGDCGAWSYKDLDVPKLGKNLVTPEWVISEYKKYFNSGDFVIAPDHMLLPGTDLEYRKKFNLNSAEKFLPIAVNEGFLPLVTVHGMSIEERLENIMQLYEIGYTNFALGGMAARASQKKTLFESIKTILDKIRSVLPSAYIHVLGLSSPDYWKFFNDIGVDSCDGSSHFKQAFTGGIFYEVDGIKLVKRQAVRVDKVTRVPLGFPDFDICYCSSCQQLRNERVDTRFYGTNENNMGRAAHNLNMLMRVHKDISL